MRRTNFVKLRMNKICDDVNRAIGVSLRPPVRERHTKLVISEAAMIQLEKMLNKKRICYIKGEITNTIVIDGVIIVSDAFIGDDYIMIEE